MMLKQEIAPKIKPRKKGRCYKVVDGHLVEVDNLRVEPKQKKDNRRNNAVKT